MRIILQSWRLSCSILALAALIPGCAMLDALAPSTRTIHTLTHNSADNLAPSWSPDGAQLVFESDLSGNWDLWMMNADGSNLRQLTREPSAERFAAWGPDGHTIVFSSNRAGSWDLWSVQSDGSRLERLTDSLRDELAPAWSADGKRIAFVSQRTDVRQVLVTPHMGDYGIWVMAADGSHQQELQPNCGDWGPSWNPAGTMIANAASSKGMSGLRVYDLESGSIQILTPQSQVPLKRRDFLPAWSPDGRQIAFISTRDGTRDIWLIDPRGEWEERLTSGLLRHQPRYNMEHLLYNGIGYYHLAWSPDNAKIAFTQINRSGKGEIAVLNVTRPDPG